MHFCLCFRHRINEIYRQRLLFILNFVSNCQIKYYLALIRNIKRSVVAHKFIWTLRPFLFPFPWSLTSLRVYKILFFLLIILQKSVLKHRCKMFQDMLLLIIIIVIRVIFKFPLLLLSFLKRIYSWLSWVRPAVERIFELFFRKNTDIIRHKYIIDIFGEELVFSGSFLVFIVLFLF